MTSFMPCATGMHSGKLIALEGLDGCGKTTQVTHLARQLRARGYKVHCTSEPSGGPIGVLVRRALQEGPGLSEATLALLFAADRLDHVHSEIEPHLRRGDVVITDRYLVSSLAYQSTHLPLPWVASINNQAPRPHLSIVLRLAAGDAAQRVTSRGSPAERFEVFERQQRLAQFFDVDLGKLDDAMTGPWRAVDAGGDEETVARQVLEAAMTVL